jgi:plastocyanin
MRRTTVLLTLVLAAGVVLAGCGDDDDGIVDDIGVDDDGDAGTAENGETGETVTITAEDFSFDPTEVSLTAGEEATLEVENAGNVGHNLTIEDLDVDADVGAGGSTSVSVTPDAGEYEFYCGFHPGQMTGTLTVD